mmetsp:Transcript_97363/g.208904  ORF Transcript_97363/g.208904 Transcript_97363/m.208904 type:complete len:223 (-) Transcript_97363:804-1472(-)
MEGKTVPAAGWGAPEIWTGSCWAMAEARGALLSGSGASPGARTWPWLWSAGTRRRPQCPSRATRHPRAGQPPAGQAKPPCSRASPDGSACACRGGNGRRCSPCRSRNGPLRRSCNACMCPRHALPNPSMVRSLGTHSSKGWPWQRPCTRRQHWGHSLHNHHDGRLARHPRCCPPGCPPRPGAGPAWTANCSSPRSGLLWCSRAHSPRWQTSRRRRKLIPPAA